MIASPRYGTVSVLTNGPLSSTVRGLSGIPFEQLQPAQLHLARLHLAQSRGAQLAAGANSDQVEPGSDPRADELDVFVCWSDAKDPFGHAGNRRDAVYADINGTAELRTVTAAAADLHARRLLLLAPLVAWHQVSAASRMLPEAMEMELARLRIASIVIMRPTTERRAAAVAGASRLQRFARFYLSQLRFMLPAVTQSLRSTDIARAALAVMAEADAPGLTVVPLDKIRQHAGKRRAARLPPLTRT